MASENKRDLVEKLVDLTVRDPIGSISGNPSQLDLEMYEKMRQRFREEQINIRFKHFSTDQLIALLNFYETDMSESILITQNDISEEIISGFQLVSEEVSKEYSEKRHEEDMAHAQAHKDQFSDDGT